MKQIYMTPKTSATGKAVNKVLDRCIEFTKAEKHFKEKYHVKTIFHFVDQLCGAVCVELSDKANRQSWIPFSSEKYIPGKDKALMNDWHHLQSLSVPVADIDACIGGYTSFFLCGFERTRDHFLFIVDSDWDYVLPDDLQLITDDQYQQLHKIESL